MSLSTQQVAFDAAVKALSDALYSGIADLEEYRKEDPSLGPWIDQLVTIRQAFNDALAIEGQNLTGDAPHAPFYFDYIDSRVSNALAFRDADHSFIGLTIPLVREASSTARLLAESDALLSGIGLAPMTDRDVLHGLLFWILLGFVISHEYAHHTHGHLDGAFDVDEIIGGAVTGNLRQQAHEVDADGWAAYLTLAHWVLGPGRQTIVEMLSVQDAATAVQDDVVFACFVVAQAAFTFLRQPEPLTKELVYRRTHPPQAFRLQLMSRWEMKFITDFRPALRESMTQHRYQSLMDIVSGLMWKSATHPAGWHTQAEFLRTPEGKAYTEALIREVDAFRESLRERADGKMPWPGAGV